MSRNRAQELFERIENEGLAAIDEFIAQAASEELFLDFKRSADNGEGKSLHNNDRRNYAKAISGFGNSEGGLIVWGIDCSPDQDGADVAGEKFPITNPERFKGWLDNATSGMTVPPHGGVLNHIVKEDDETGYVVTLIPKSDHAPHQTVKELKYYIRSGSSFAPTPHAVLSGMFGRRPQPRIFHNWVEEAPKILAPKRVELNVGLMVCNGGPGIAENVFVNLVAIDVPGDNCAIHYSEPKADTWTGNFSLGRFLSVITRVGVRIPPNAWLDAFRIDFVLEPPFEKPLQIKGECGGTGSETFPIEISVGPEKLSNALEEFCNAVDSGTSIEEARDIISDPLLKGQMGDI